MPPADALSDDFDAAIEQFRLAQEAFCRGDPEPQNDFSPGATTSRSPIRSVPFGVVGPRSRKRLSKPRPTSATAARFVTRRCRGYVTPELAYVVRVERVEVKVGGREEPTPLALRVTMIFRREDDTWKIVHRHADPITAVRPAESVIQN